MHVREYGVILLSKKYQAFPENDFKKATLSHFPLIDQQEEITLSQVYVEMLWPLILKKPKSQALLKL